MDGGECSVMLHQNDVLRTRAKAQQDDHPEYAAKLKRWADYVTEKCIRQFHESLQSQG